ncbi:MAG TPA: Ig domain-containing protein, partial [Bdellovibrionales bacterium]|nr:Ig domain-containing protein [Bdellovibrionales bacterium]
MKTSKWLQRLSCLALMLAFSAGCSKVQQLAETVAQESLSIVTTSLAPAVINKFYGDNLTASGGAYPYTFALVAGSLPPGLAMSEQGAITGTPTSLGNYSMTVQVTDSAGATSTSTFGITVTSEITITTPSLPPATT